MRQRSYLKLTCWLLIIGLVSVEVFLTGRAWQQKNTTGTLFATSSDRGAVLSLAKEGAEPTIIGTGSAKVRIAAGTYQLTVSNGQGQASKSFTVSATKIVSLNIAPPSLAATSQAAGNNTQVNALVKLLPFTGPDSSYAITYSYDFSGPIAKPTITITAPDTAAQQAAVAWLKSLRFDLTKLPLKYVTSPITHQAP